MADGMPGATMLRLSANKLADMTCRRLGGDGSVHWRAGCDDGEIERDISRGEVGNKHSGQEVTERKSPSSCFKE